MEGQSPRKIPLKHFVLEGEHTTHCYCLAPNTFTVALDGIWSIRRNLPVGGMIPGQQSRNSSLPQAKYYSRHGGLRSKTPEPRWPKGVAQLTHKGHTCKHLSWRPTFPRLASVPSQFTYPLPVMLGLKQFSWGGHLHRHQRSSYLGLDFWLYSVRTSVSCTQLGSRGEIVFVPSF